MTDRILFAGPFRILYLHGFLRHISFGTEEVLRMIYFAYRDEHWRTLPLLVKNEKVEATRMTFRISYDATHQLEDESLCFWSVVITGNQHGEIEFEIKGEALKDHLKNRVGFCVLHPHSVSTRACELYHPDGTTTVTAFPGDVSPSDPFKNICGMSWPGAGGSLRLHLHGDTFETEDQRNWTDASFKTFCTPLSKPFPVLLKRGDRISQRVTFRPDQVRVPLPVDESIELRNSGTSITLPKIGVGASFESTQLNGRMADLLRGLSLDHYRVDAWLENQEGRQRFIEDVENGSSLGIPFAIALHLGKTFKTEVSEIQELLNRKKINVAKWILLSNNRLTTAQEVIDYAAVLQTSGSKVGAGTNYNFTELNRNRFDATPLDFVTFAANPQEHAIDDLTIVENMEGQNAVIHTAKKMYPGKEIIVSPLTLKRRFHPTRILSTDERTDSRQGTDFAAVFTIGSVIQQAMAGAAAVTLFEAIGRQGLVSADGQPYPVFNAIELFARCTHLMPLSSSHPLQCGGAVLAGETGRKILLVNYSKEERNVKFDGNKYAVGPYGWVFK